MSIFVLRYLCSVPGLLLLLAAQLATGFPVSPRCFGHGSVTSRSLQLPALQRVLDKNADSDLASSDDSLDRRSLLGAFLLAPLVAVAVKQTIGGDGSSHQTLLIQPQVEEWIGTSLPLLSLNDAYTFAEQAISSDDSEIFPFAQWPDPILRRPASTVDIILTTGDIVNSNEELIKKLQNIARILKRTADEKGAVGLAAQQCGVDVSLVYLQPNIFLLNPRIIDRSQETDMKVWTEECLVLPPWFRATVMRDASVEIEYESLSGNKNTGKLQTKQIRLRGELARAAQHEMQHDQGILLLDHVELDQLPPIMQNVERSGHDQRMEQAFSRYVTQSTRLS